MGCCGPRNTGKKEKYKCESCGAVSEAQKDCCGKPMKKEG